MKGIQIRLLGEVAYENLIKLEAGYRCDVPTDGLGIPFLPISEILRESGLFSSIPGIMVGFARPDGYLGLIREAGRLIWWFGDRTSRIRSHYTCEHSFPEEGFRIRSLRRNQLFYAPVYIPEGELKNAERFVRGITRMGVRKKGITGEVECSIVDLKEETGESVIPSDLLTFRSMEYTIVTLSPTCIDAPFEEGSKTFSYLPGQVVREAMLSLMPDGFLKTNLPQMRFSNAYIGEEGKRLLPMPLCMSLVKLDKEQLRYRLASGKDPDSVEQVVVPENAYCTGFNDHYMEYVKPVVERIVTADGKMYDTLSEGQIFRGIIYGTNAQIRSAASWIQAHPYMNVGTSTEEGYGEAYAIVEELKEEPITAQTLATCFDVCCLSHTVLIDEEGMFVCGSKDLLAEIEYKLGLPGRLEVVGRYTDVYRDFSDRYEWERENPVIRCLKMGSVLRIRTKDKTAVDISGILHTFIGEHTLNGYGEIMSWPARDGYYRIAKQTRPHIYDAGLRSSRRNLHIGARLVHSILTDLLMERVRGLALADSGENPDEMSSGAYVPEELLEELRQTYDPEVPMKTLIDWYMTQLYGKEDSDARNK